MDIHRCSVTFFLLWALAAACTVDAGSWPNMTVAQMSEWFWGPSAARLPGKDFVEAVQVRRTALSWGGGAAWSEGGLGLGGRYNPCDMNR